MMIKQHLLLLLPLIPRTTTGNPLAQCSNNAGCNALGLVGSCCPTVDNILLDCCDEAETVPSPTPPIGDSKCSSFTNCAGLTGDCCPTAQGTYLYCCASDPVEHTASPTKGPAASPTEPLTPTPTRAPVSSILPPTGNVVGPPTVSPTESPTESPTQSPTESPTQSPTESPTQSPPTDAPVSSEGPLDWGPNFVTLNDGMPTSEIQGLFDHVFENQVDNEMGMERYGIYFLPGEYGSPEEPLSLQLGYYTEIAGLGKLPGDVVIHGKIEVYNRCFEKDAYFQDGEFIPTDGSGHCIALNNFWRSLSNLSIRIVSKNQDACRRTANFWAISQASSMRRVHFSGGDVSLMDYCTTPAFASGGFVADSLVQGKIENGAQQQWISRNIEVNQWSGSVWNQVFLGVIGAPDDSTFPDPPFTTIAETPMKREKPFLFVEEEMDDYYVFVPSIQTVTQGISWERTNTPGTTVPISDFMVVTPSSLNIEAVNAGLASGKHLLFTPGVYFIDETISVNKAGTVVLGIGHATLTAMDGVVPLKTSASSGIILAGITIDAGPQLSPVLLEVGSPVGSDRKLETSSNPADPITLSDVYFRVGGPDVGKTLVALEINADHVLIDHTWVWRADHGIEDFDKTDGYAGDNERWEKVIGKNGVVVNGDDVTAIGLFVEHFQEHNLVWNGQGGRVYLFQSELAYEPPTQEDWMKEDGTLGWAGYKLSDDVDTHNLWGGGVYCYNRNNPDVVTSQAFEAPGKAGVVLKHIMTRNLSGPGTIQSVANGIGYQVDAANQGPSYLVEFSSGAPNGGVIISEINEVQKLFVTDKEKSKFVYSFVPSVCVLLIVVALLFRRQKRKNSKRYVGLVDILGLDGVLRIDSHRSFATKANSDMSESTMSNRERGEIEIYYEGSLSPAYQEPKQVQYTERNEEKFDDELTTTTEELQQYPCQCICSK